MGNLPTSLPYFEARGVPKAISCKMLMCVVCVFSSDREERGPRGARGLWQPLLVGAQAAGAGEHPRPAARRGARRQVSPASVSLT